MFASLKHQFKILPRSKHTQSRVTKPAQAPQKNKTNKQLDAPNLHRHQKNKRNKPLDAPNLHTFTGTKTKKTKKSRNYGPFLNSCWNLCFFVFFGACRCLVHLILFFFWCLSMFCEVRVTETEEQKISQVVRRRYSAEFCG